MAEQEEDRHLHAMYKAYGRDPKHTCGQCVRCVLRSETSTRRKCTLSWLLGGPGVKPNWQTDWEACGQFKRARGTPKTIKAAEEG